MMSYVCGLFVLFDRLACVTILWLAHLIYYRVLSTSLIYSQASPSPLLLQISRHLTESPAGCPQTPVMSHPPSICQWMVSVIRLSGCVRLWSCGVSDLPIQRTSSCSSTARAFSVRTARTEVCSARLPSSYPPHSPSSGTSK